MRKTQSLFSWDHQTLPFSLCTEKTLEMLKLSLFLNFFNFVVHSGSEEGLGDPGIWAGPETRAGFGGRNEGVGGFG